MTTEQYEATLGLTPVRDSADAVERAFADLDRRQTWPSRRLVSLMTDSTGYWLIIDVEDRTRQSQEITMLVKRNGAVYDILTVQ